MTDLHALLGLDPQSDDALRARQLVRGQRHLMRALVQIREDRNLTQAAVGARMGVSQPTIASLEAYDSNPTLSTIRRYAHAVGAIVAYNVQPDNGQLRTMEARYWMHEPYAASWEVEQPTGPRDRGAPPTNWQSGYGYSLAA